MPADHDLFKEIVNALEHNEDEVAVEKVDQFIKQFGQESFLKLYAVETIPCKISGNDASAPLLFIACKENYFRLAEKLISCGVSINEGSVSKFIHYHNFSPLMIAASARNERIVRLLLKNKANIFHLSGFNETALMMCATKEIGELLIEQAKAEGCLEQFLSLRNNYMDTAFGSAAYNNNLPLLDYLMSIEHWEKYANMTKLLHHARFASWSFPENYERYDQICSIVKSKEPTIGHAPIDLQTHMEFQSIENSYQTLFGKGNARGRVVDDEASALKVILAEAYSLLGTPARCMKYLDFLNKELTHYEQLKEKYHTQSFPKVDPSTITMQPVDGVYYPIPNESYNFHTHKDGALQKVLISLFQKYDLAKEAFKWIGFIPHEIADKMVINGDFVTESVYGPGLFHGLLAHMLQQAILIYAIENEEIHTDFIIDGKERRFSIKEILAAFITQNVWGFIRDTRQYDYIKFSDPHRLISIIMKHGKELNMPVLADSLIDSFCKGLRKYITALKIISPQLNYTPDEFVNKMKDILLSIFNIPNNLIRYAKAYDKKIHETIIKGDRYAAVPLSYQLDNPYFQAHHYDENLSVEDMMKPFIELDAGIGLDDKIFKMPQNELIQYCRYHVLTSPNMIRKILSVSELINTLGDIGIAKVIELSPEICFQLFQKGKEFYSQFGKEILGALCIGTTKKYPEVSIEILSTPELLHKLGDLVPIQIIDHNQEICIGLYKKGREVYAQLGKYGLFALCSTTAVNNPEISIDILSNTNVGVRMGNFLKSILFGVNPAIREGIKPAADQAVTGAANNVNGFFNIKPEPENTISVPSENVLSG